MEDIVLAVLGSGGIAAFFTMLFTRKSHEDNVTLKYVTDERRKWRENIKVIMGDLCDAVHAPRLHDVHIQKTRKLATLLKLNLNNVSSESLDRDILRLLNKLCKNPQYIYFQCLEKQICTLLKHDWERAKLEADTRSISITTIGLAALVIWGGFSTLLLDSKLVGKLQSYSLLAGIYEELFIICLLFVVAIFGTPRLIKKIRLNKCKNKYYKTKI
ncbi:hypothetical protein B7489_23525 [Vibrio alginolyticus]|uniref:hypothetical protein n=1 Tax=Vibrio alginolyticus TaxID=663 RepID=UPI000A1F5682|nr:hypothetical protein [Vibrio alginolyticus]ELA7834490.1 hypothetical protein [Vibrio alginolyticus]MCS0282060.1 hypothetical protein [Vibrio alginolyticus]OSP08380.1 hypothetical protein B7489_23525 [Vibrio alginolyticus]